MQVLVVREHCVAGSAEEVVVPNADEGEDNRHVLVGRSGLEVLIHLVGALVELHVVFEADAEGDGKISLGVPRTARAGRAILQGVPCGPGARPDRSCNGTTVPPQGVTIPNARLYTFFFK